MKKLIFILPLIIGMSCTDRPEYAALSGAFATYYPTVVADYDEKVLEVTTVTVEATGVVKRKSHAYIAIPADGSIITDPPYDPFTKELAVEIKRTLLVNANGDSTYKYLGNFDLSYRNNDTEQKKSIYELPIVRTDGDIAGVANNIFYMKVKDDEFRLDVDSTVVLQAPFLENFNSGILDDGFCEDETLEVHAPKGWTAYSVQSERVWACSFDGRGVTGSDGDIAMEMNNYLSPDGEAANDWLITPKIDISSGDKQLSFASMLRFDGTIMKVFYTTNYVPGAIPSGYEWTELTAATAALDSNTGSYDFVESGAIDLSALEGQPENIYIAFQYTSVGAASGESSVARIDNFEIK